MSSPPRGVGTPIDLLAVHDIAGLVHQSLVGLAPAYLADDYRQWCIAKMEVGIRKGAWRTA